MASKPVMICLMVFYVALVVAYIREGSLWKAVYFASALSINFSVYMMK